MRPIRGGNPTWLAYELFFFLSGQASQGLRREAKRIPNEFPKITRKSPDKPCCWMAKAIGRRDHVNDGVLWGNGCNNNMYSVAAHRRKERGFLR
jgi:hypothetical protein